MINFRNWSFHEMPKRSYQEPYHSPLRRVLTALIHGAICHGVFAVAAAAMVFGMYYGLSEGLGRCPSPWSWIANTLLILQFPVGHSVLLTARGQKVLRIFAPATIGTDLSTTTYVTLASLQVLSLFALWTPSGVIWWQASGWSLVAMSTLYAASWLLVGKASFDAGFEVQSGMLGWVSLARGVKPVYPEMPVNGLFAYSRQPIYSSFALTLWTVPTWTPDQLALAIGLTLYCVVGPLFKERRFARLFGERFLLYKQTTPYWVPTRTKKRS
jgi:methanethiol S-methyltransferase